MKVVFYFFLTMAFFLSTTVYCAGTDTTNQNIELNISSARGPVNSRGLSAAAGSPAAVVALMKKLPLIDGEIQIDPAWRSIPKHDMMFVDEWAPGTPRERTRIQLGCDENNLYIAFNCKLVRGGRGGRGRKKDDPKIINGGYTGVVLDLGPGKKENRYFAILMTGYGVTYTAARAAESEKWDTSWELPGLEVGVTSYVTRWTGELKVPLDGDLKDIPRMIGANFLRSHWRGATPPTDYRFFNVVYAWKQLLHVENRKQKQMAQVIYTLDPVRAAKAGRDFFGRLYIEAGKKEPENLKKIVTESAKPAPETPEDIASKILPGFDISEAELVKHYGRKVMMVPSTRKPPVIDGDSEDPVWKEIAWTRLGFLVHDVPGVDKRNPAMIKAVTDSENFYFIAYCAEEEVSKLKMHKKFVSWKHDCLELFFDVGHLETHASCYQIIVNPLGACALIKDRADTRWKAPGMDLKAKIGKDYWAVEFKIPFTSMGVSSDYLPKLWGANVTRTRWVNRPPEGVNAPGELNWDLAWVSNSFGDPHLPDRWGHLYLQAGNAYPKELARKSSGNVSVYERKAPDPVDIKPAKRTAEFKKKPRITVNNKQATITFEVAKPVDVAVGIINSKGRVIRHLAAGVLGKNPPRPLTPDSLTQTLIWDFTDDQGKEVPRGKYKVRVGLGLDIEFDRTLLWSPYEQRGIVGITTGADGELYVMNNWGGMTSHPRWNTIMIYDREGKYKRQIYPFPGNQSADKVKGARVVTLADGRWIPTIYAGLAHSILPWNEFFSSQMPVVTPDGRFVFLSASDKHIRIPKRLLALGTDGSVPEDFAGPILLQEEVRGIGSVACSPDGKTFYVTGMRGRSIWPQRGGEPHHCVFRVQWDAPRPPWKNFSAKPFIGEFEFRGGGKTHLNNPKAIDVDDKGNIYVADTGNRRIVAFKPNGTYVGEFEVHSVRAMKVHPKTGVIYALCAGKQRSVLKKFTSMDGNMAAKIELPLRNTSFLALDASRKTPRLWAAHGSSILQIDDKDTLVCNGDVLLKRRSPDWGPSPRPRFDPEIFHDPQNQRLYIVNGGRMGGGEAYDGNTGAHVRHIPVNLPGKGHVEFANILPDGTFVGMSKGRGSGIRRYNRDWKPITFSATGKHLVPERVYQTVNCDWSSLGTGPQGHIAVYSPKHGITLWSMDGKRIKKKIVDMEGQHILGKGVRIDSTGAVYAGVPMRDPKGMIDPLVRGRLPRGFGFNPWPRWNYIRFAGAVAKFKPEGGSLRRKPDGDLLVGIHDSGINRCKATGLEWLRYGFSPMGSMDSLNFNCKCDQGNFDLDPFDRLYVPDSMTARVQVVDRNNNRIVSLGEYGNADANKPGSKPVAKLPVCWPCSVSAGEKYLYIADTMNNRILRVKLIYMKESSRPFKF